MYRVDHDNSMLVPELWCRMRVHEREPQFLIDKGLLEKVEDFDHNGRRILASRLGYRITELFVDRFLGRIFELPGAVFPDLLLRPEKQDMENFVKGMEAICDAQRIVALNYFEDGSVNAACPPIRALLHIMAYGAYEGKGIEDRSLRGMFTREALLASGWYAERLATKQQRDIALWTRHAAATNSAAAKAELTRVSSPKYLEELLGTIGADPFHGQ
jgi:hypothetical protein